MLSTSGCEQSSVRARREIRFRQEERHDVGVLDARKASLTSCGIIMILIENRADGHIVPFKEVCVRSAQAPPIRFG
jgi:hypothetical protein